MWATATRLKAHQRVSVQGGAGRLEEIEVIPGSNRPGAGWPWVSIGWRRVARLQLVAVEARQEEGWFWLRMARGSSGTTWQGRSASQPCRRRSPRCTAAARWARIGALLG